MASGIRERGSVGGGIHSTRDILEKRATIDDDDGCRVQGRYNDLSFFFCFAGLDGNIAVDDVELREAGHAETTYSQQVTMSGHLLCSRLTKRTEPRFVAVSFI